MTKQLGDGEERGQHELLVHLEWINSLEYLLKMVSAQVVVQILKKMSERSWEIAIEDSGCSDSSHQNLNNPLESTLN